MGAVVSASVPMRALYKYHYFYFDELRGVIVELAQARVRTKVHVKELVQAQRRTEEAVKV